MRWCAEHDEQRFAELLADSEALWHVLRPITAADMDRAPRLRLIQKLGIGVNTIDLDSARARGIAVANMPGVNAPAVAESSVALMLAASRRLVELDRRTRTGRGWPIDTSLAATVGELGDSTVGLIGYGNIARRVEHILRAFGTTVIHTAAHDDGEDTYRTLDELLTASDVVSVHIPLTDVTHGMLGAAQLELMRPGSVLVNTARGEIVDEPALVAALRSGRLGAAGLDVFASEPLDASSPLIELDNVVIQPHVAWLTSGTIHRCTAIAADNTRRMNHGDEILNAVVRGKR